jgi:hypothetical protein
MRTKQLITGLKNSQKIRVILNGVGMYMQVKDLPSAFAFTDQRVAVCNAVEHIGTQRLQGYGKSYEVYDNQMKKTILDLQVDLV